MRQHLQSLLANQRRLNFFIALMSVLPVTRGIALDLFALRILRYGAKRSWQSLLWISLMPMIMLGLGKYYFALFYLGFSILPIFFMAAYLGQSNHWQRLVEGLMLALLLLCFLVQFTLPVAWFNFLTLPFVSQWQALSQQWLQDGFTIPIEQIKQLLPIGFCVYIFSNISHIFIARALQAWCFNPGGFKQELSQFSLSLITLVVLAGSLVAAAFGTQHSFALLGGLLAVLPLALLGFIKVFAYATRFRQSFWLLPLAVLLIVVALPYSFFLLVVMGLIDIILKYLGVSYASHFARKSS